MASSRVSGIRGEAHGRRFNMVADAFAPAAVARLLMPRVLAAGGLPRIGDVARSSGSIPSHAASSVVGDRDGSYDGGYGGGF